MARHRSLASRLTLLAALWAVVPALAVAQAPANRSALPLKAYASDAWGPPFLLPPSDTPTSAPTGLIPDWYEALGRALRRPIEVRFVPPNRIPIASEAVRPDLGCFGAAEWEGQDGTPPYVNASTPFLRVDEVLASQRPTVTRLADLRGQRVGTVNGYVYPSLEDAFRDGAMKREDAPNEMAMLRKQLRGRSDHAVVRRLTLEHLQATDPQWAALQPSPWRVSSTLLFCGVRRGGALSLADLEAAQRQLLQDGTLARLLKRYGGTLRPDAR